MNLSDYLDPLPVATITSNGLMSSSDKSKLDGVEAFADVTDATNVTSAGAIMKVMVNAKGDLIVATSGNNVTRVPLGSNGQVLTVNTAQSSGVGWTTPSTGGSSMNPSSYVQVANSSYTVPGGYHASVVVNDSTLSGAIWVPSGTTIQSDSSYVRIASKYVASGTNPHAEVSVFPN